MAFDTKLRDFFSTELKNIQEKGLFKEERYIASPQSAMIKVEYPAGSQPKEVINFCANNYLGLSSHPEVIKAAQLGLENNIISQEEFSMIKRAEETKQRPPWNTALGGEIGIHGGGNTHDWTQGCIALSDEDIILIGQHVTSNTSVEIFE